MDDLHQSVCKDHDHTTQIVHWLFLSATLSL